MGAKMGDFLRVKKSVVELEGLLKLRLRPFRHKAGHDGRGGQGAWWPWWISDGKMAKKQ